jgi:hypothetical protein
MTPLTRLRVCHISCLSPLTAPLSPRDRPMDYTLRRCDGCLRSEAIAEVQVCGNEHTDWERVEGLESAINVPETLKQQLELA